MDLDQHDVSPEVAAVNAQISSMMSQLNLSKGPGPSTGINSSATITPPPPPPLQRPPTTVPVVPTSVPPVPPPIPIPVTGRSSTPSTSTAQATSQPTTATTPAIPLTLGRVETAAYDVSGLQLTVRTDLAAKYGSLGQLTSLGRELEKWTDDMMLRHDKLELTILDHPTLLALSKEFIGDLITGISERTVGILMMLAWNLSSIRDGRRVYQEIVIPAPASFEPNLPVPVSYTTLSQTVIVAGTVSNIPVFDGLDDEQITRSACFVAASMLRLFAKPESSYTEAYGKGIREAYSKFYHKRFPLAQYNLDKACIQGISNIMSNVMLFKGTLGVFLYFHRDITDDKGMCRLLFEMHLGMVGMHAIGMFIRVCQAMKTSGEMLIYAMWHKSTRSALECIFKTLSVYLNKDNDPELRRGTWIYARLFEQTAFLPIQTKHCKELVCMLAHLLNFLGDVGNKNPLEIVHIKALPHATQEIYKGYAWRVFCFFETGALAADGDLSKYSETLEDNGSEISKSDESIHNDDNAILGRESTVDQADPLTAQTQDQNTQENDESVVNEINNNLRDLTPPEATVEPTDIDTLLLTIGDEDEALKKVREQFPSVTMRDLAFFLHGYRMKADYSVAHVTRCLNAIESQTIQLNTLANKYRNMLGQMNSDMRKSVVLLSDTVTNITGSQSGLKEKIGTSGVSSEYGPQELNHSQMTESLRRIFFCTGLEVDQIIRLTGKPVEYIYSKLRSVIVEASNGVDLLTKYGDVTTTVQELLRIIIS